MQIGLEDRRSETIFPTQQHQSLGEIYSRTAGHLDVRKDEKAVLMAVSEQSTVFEIDLDGRTILWEYRFADADTPQILAAKYCYDVSFEMNQTKGPQ